MEVIHTIGRRKTAVARIYLKAGNGTITVNKRELNNYFTTPTLQYKVKQALSLVGAEDTYDVKVNVYGGGITGQAEAVRLAIARALCELDAENRAVLKPEGLLTRDPPVRDSNSLNVNINLLLSLASKWLRRLFHFSKTSPSYC